MASDDTDRRAAEWLAGLERAIAGITAVSLAAMADLRVSLVRREHLRGCVLVVHFTLHDAAVGSKPLVIQSSYAVRADARSRHPNQDTPSQYLGTRLRMAWTDLAAHVMHAGDHRPTGETDAE